MEWLWIIPVLPLAGALIQGILVLSGSANSQTSTVLGIVLPALSLSVAIASVWVYGTLQYPAPFEQTFFTWSDGTLAVEVSFLLDSLSAAFLFIVAFVGLWIAVFAAGRMQDHVACGRFFAYLGLLQASVLLLVLAGNLLMLLAGWQGIALSSYLLIALSTDSEHATRAAHQTFIVHRIGDLGLLLAIFAFFAHFGSLDIREILEGIASGRALAVVDLTAGTSWPTFIALALLVAAMVKSAQGPFFAWLTDAIVAPIPATAFLNTLAVSTGAYLLLRFGSILQLAPVVTQVTVIVGAASALLAAIAAIAQTDIRRALSYIAVSQMGSVYLAIGIGALSEAAFWIVAQVFFMTLLFLCAGSVSHALAGEHDLLRMGGLRQALPWTSASYLVGVIAIAGFPALSSFSPQGSILSAAWHASPVLWLFAMSTLLIVAFSLFRIYWLVFWDDFRGDLDLSEELRKPPTTMAAARLALALGTILIAWYGSLPSTHHDWLGGPLSPAPLGDRALATAVSISVLLEFLMFLAGSTAAVAGVVVSWRIYGADFGLQAAEIWASRYPRAHHLLLHGYGIKRLYQVFFMTPSSFLSRRFNQVVDTWIIGGASSVLGFFPLLAGALARQSSTGNIRHYALYFLAGALLIFFWVVL